jgi:hypothetical protein
MTCGVRSPMITCQHCQTATLSELIAVAAARHSDAIGRLASASVCPKKHDMSRRQVTCIAVVATIPSSVSRAVTVRAFAQTLTARRHRCVVTSFVHAREGGLHIVMMGCSHAVVVNGQYSVGLLGMLVAAFNHTLTARLSPAVETVGMAVISALLSFVLPAAVVVVPLIRQSRAPAPRSVLLAVQIAPEYPSLVERTSLVSAHTSRKCP